MKILVITPYYGSDLGPSAPLITMLCEDLATAGHEITVLAAVSHYPSGIVQNEGSHNLWSWTSEGAVQVCRVWVPGGNRRNLSHRLLIFTIYQLLASLAGLAQKCDALLVTNPALESFLPFMVLGWLRRRPVLYAVWDLYPEVGIQLGIFRNRLATKIVAILEDACLHWSAAVQIISPGFRSILERRGVSPDKIALVLPWVQVDSHLSTFHQNRFASENGLTEKFVVIYSGNLGFSQDFESILGAASLLKADPSITFVVIGDGVQKDRVVEMADQMKLDKILFLPFQPRIELDEVMAAGDCALVTQKKGMESSSLPSKFFSYLAHALPVISITCSDSPLARLVDESGGGVLSPPGDSNALARLILGLKADPERSKSMGCAGRAFVLKHCSRQAAAAKFGELFASL